MRYIISLGGSLIAPRGIDVNFLKKFRRILLGATNKGNKFLVIPGGGMTCRNYQNSASQIAKISNDGLDWIGIKTNQLHSYFLHAIFGKTAHPEVVQLDSKARIAKPIAILLGGLKPGGTSDSTAVRFAEKFKTNIIINLTNVSGVYDRDPKKYKNAKLIRSMTWVNLKKQFGSDRTPGRNLPFDSSVVSLAARLGLKVVIMDGRNLKNFQNFLAGRKFRGTIIQ